MSQLRLTVAQGRPQWVLWSDGEPSCYDTFMETHPEFPYETWDWSASTYTDTAGESQDVNGIGESQAIARATVAVTDAVGSTVALSTSAGWNLAMGVRVLAGEDADHRVLEAYATTNQAPGQGGPDEVAVEYIVGTRTLSAGSPTAEVFIYAGTVYDNGAADLSSIRGRLCIDSGALGAWSLSYRPVGSGGSFSYSATTATVFSTVIITTYSGA